MKKILLVSALSCMLVFTSCGPAAENREAMHVRAKSFQDSIALIIRTSMAEAAAPGPGQQQVKPDTSVKMITPGSPTVK